MEGAGVSLRRAFGFGTTSDFVLSSVILTSPDKLTLAVGLFRYVSEETSTNYPVFAAGEMTTTWLESRPTRAGSPGGSRASVVAGALMLIEGFCEPVVGDDARA